MVALGGLGLFLMSDVPLYRSHQSLYKKVPRDDPVLRVFGGGARGAACLRRHPRRQGSLLLSSLELSDAKVYEP